MIKKIYLACAISTISSKEAAEAFTESINWIKNSLREEGYEVLEFLTAIRSGTPQEIYAYDIHDCVAKADAVLAICDHPSTGLGYELGVAVEKRGIPVYATAHMNSKVSNLILGITHPRFLFERYTDIREIPKKFEEFIKQK